MTVTLKDIAKKAGVSISTVSRVINNDLKKPASPKTAEKVWTIVKEMGYVPNVNARNLVKTSIKKNNLNQTISCILASQSDSYNDPFFSQIMMGIQSEAAQHGYFVGYTFSHTGDEGNLYQHIASAKVDGTIVLGRMSEEFFNFLNGNIKNLVYVGLNRIRKDIDEVICDAYDSTCYAVEHLISLGHKKIGYIGTIPSIDKNNVINEHRYAAFEDTLSKHSLAINKNHIKGIHLSLKEGLGAMDEILETEDYPSAVFCGNDIVAIGVIKSIQKKGLKVPRDISVIGLNNIEVSEYIRPALTTIHVPKEELGRFGVKLLIDRINKGHKEKVLVNLPYKLINRESCAPYNRKE